MAFPADRNKVVVSGSFGARPPIRLTNGQLSGGFHYAVDLAPKRRGYAEPVYSVSRAKIIDMGRKADAGIYIIIELPNGERWRYCHLSLISAEAQRAYKSGSWLTDAAYLGRMGATGNVTGVHLHLELYPAPRQLSRRVDPWPVIRRLTNPAHYARNKPKASSTKPPKTKSKGSEPTIAWYATQVIKGAYGTGDERRRKLGSKYAQVQAEVNRRLAAKR